MGRPIVTPMKVCLRRLALLLAWKKKFDQVENMVKKARSIGLRSIFNKVHLGWGRRILIFYDENRQREDRDPMV